MQESHCKHCSLRILDENLAQTGFCCPGCKEAYKIINEIGLGNYYQYKINNPNVRNLKPELENVIDNANFATQLEENKFEIVLALDGLHCAACVWLIENLLKKEEKVYFVRINLTKKYLKLRWSGEKQDINQIILPIIRIGYKVFLFDEEFIEEQEKRSGSDLIKRLAVAGFGAGNIMLISIILWFYKTEEIGTATKNFLHLLSALIALPTIIYASKPFFHSAFLAIRNKRSNMDIAISVAIFLACVTSFFQSLNSAQHIYFDSATMLCFFLLIGKYLDLKARKKVFQASKEFAFLNSNYARIINENNVSKIIAAREVKKGQIILVALGEKVACDGILIDEMGEFDNSIISGESLPQTISKNQEVFAGAVNLGPNVRIRVSKAQNESLTAKIKAIIENCENYKGKYVRICDKISVFYTPIVHILALATFSFWYFIKSSLFEDSIVNAVSTLIITCPCALALAVPIAQSLAISSFLKNSILLKSGEIIEKINGAKIFIFDKTGSLTYGKPKITKFYCLNREISKTEESEFLKIAASLAVKSNHPVSKAIFEYYNNQIIDLNVIEENGHGLKSFYLEKTLKIGKADFVFTKEYALKKVENDKQKTFFRCGDDFFVFYYEDILKSDAGDVISELKKLGKRVILLSGDEKEIVTKTAFELGIDEYFYEKNPIEKTKILQNLKNEQGKIVMIGDGVNDSACLALSDIAISFFSAASISQNSADVIIQNLNLSPILQILKISKQSLKIIKQNLAFSLTYNLLAIPFAFLGFVTPLVAALAMSLSSLVVVLNSLRIINKK